ncbi:hypothetical protein LDENG_00089770 [Lucifuga dentata]|nr:hypothetical protein LDENG_00089770 [Lucifuga dentata]
MLQCEHSGGIRKRRENTNTHIHAHTLAALFPNLVDEEICCGTVATQADMEDYLRRVHSRLGAWEFDGPSIHVVLGGPEPDVDTIASTLCLALHLSQKDLSGGLCVPLLSGWRCDTVLPGETVRYLQKVKICESLLLWKDDVDLVKLHHNGKLSLMLLRDGLLDGSEYHTLESSILQVVHHDRQQDAGDDGASSTVTTVTREILQEAAEHIGAALGEALGEALRLQSEALWMKHGRRSVHLEELINSLEQRSDVTVGQHDEAKLQDLEDLMTKDLKEFSDGEMTIALTSVTMGEERGYMDQLKSFSDRHGYDGLVVVFSISDTVQLLCQRVAVYSNNTDILNQICSELEEYSNWSHGEQEFKECLSGCLQVYHLAMNTSSPSSTSSLLEKEIQGLLKEYVDQRSSVLACHPSSRTSSTEGVAGSVEFSQGSSGINSDIERAEGGNGDAGIESRVMENGEEDSGTVGVGAGGELVSPDSGMTTIRSSRSSKESSVFLSDESPIGEIIAGGGPAVGFLRNPSPLGFSCLPPPAPPERRKHRSSRNKSDNLDLFSFDPLHSSNHSMPAGGALTHTGERGDEGERKAGSSSLSEFEELNLVDFSAPSSVGDSINSSSHHQQYHGDVHAINVIDTVVPPTPVNSLVGSCPSSSCEVSFFPEDIAERISCLQHKDSVSSSLSEAWDELGFEMNQEWSSTDNMTKKSKNSWNIVERVQDKESSGKARESSEEILQSKNSSHKVMSLEPQLSLITEHSESYDNWNPNSVLKDQWNPVSLSDLQLTPPEEDEEDDGLQGKKGERQMELLDFWTYSAQKGLLKSDSGTTTSYPESLDMWNMTIRDDSISPLTTPDNLSEHSDSFCGRIPKLEGGTSVESPPGFSDGGMEMWNTTIQEDSSSTVTSPEGPQTGSDLEHMGSWDATETHANKQVEEDKAIDNEEYTNKVLSQTPDKVGLIGEGNDHNVKIVIEGAEGRIQTEETGYDDIQNVQSPQSIMHNLASENLQDGTSPCEGPHIWDMPIPGMVTSTSEYDNVGADAWSLPSSPDAYANPVVDMVQLEGQSSPFIAVAKPVQLDKRHEQYQMSDFLGYGAVMADEKPANQVFTFDRPVELDHMTRSGRSSVESKYDNKSEQESEWIEPPRDHSPFVVITHHSCSGEAAVTKTLTDQSSTPSLVMWDNLPAISKKQDDLETASNNISSSHDLPIKMVCNEDRPGTESQVENNEGNGNVEGTITDTMFLSPSSGEEKETLKYSPDSFHPGSRDDLRSNSDGDSSSGLEMEYIIVSGTVKETERERKHQPKECDSVRQARGTGKSMETFSMLSFAATVLQSQEWLTEQQIGSHGVSQERESPIAGCQDVTSQLSFQLPSDDAVHQWTGYQNVTQSQTQYGYNYHHIDQRTENQTIHQGCIHTKSSSQQNTTDVYAEFTTVATQLMPASEPAGNDNEAGDHVEYSLDDPGARFQYLAKGQYAGDSSSLCASELKCSQYQADDQSHYNTDSHYQFDGKNFNQSDTYPDSERQDHAQYVPEGYVHFLLSREAQLQLKCRSSQQEDSAARMMMKTTSSEEAAEEIDNREDPPSSLDLSGGSTQRRKLAAPPMNVSLDHSEGSLLSDDALDTEDEALDTGDDLDVNLDELDTPDEADSLDFNTHGDSEEYNLDAGAATSDVVPGHSAGEESRDSRLWRSVVIGEQEHRIDMKCIESYKRVISHGGYYAEHNAIIVFAACFLPDSDCDNYNYVMENLFLYVISTLELMVAENYMIVYLNGATPRRRMPGFTWMKKCYQMIDRRLKKNLKMFIIAHPSWFIRTLLGITRPFISSKFSSKIKYVNSLEELREIIPMEYVHIPSSIIKYEEERGWIKNCRTQPKDVKKGNSG